MAPYRFLPGPSNASVDTLVTMLVSGWFLAAGVAIFTGLPSSPPTHLFAGTAEPAPSDFRMAPVAVAPEARFRIVVEGRRIRA